jgi:hypothetical protein
VTATQGAWIIGLLTFIAIEMLVIALLTAIQVGREARRP